MTLSGRRESDLADLERDLSTDPALRALTGLFPRPPEPRRDQRQPTDEAPTRKRPGLPTVLGAVLVALGGLLLCVLAAPTDEPFLAAAGVVLSLCAVMFLATVPRRNEAREPG
ncbi:MAG TPA: hypothetical protein VHV49_12500 [Pseudonocardiaceae bacterium]|jgi:hypothetical protein|nr:hypothetical protein [Pseudonocardiaceae bacterium]